MKPNWETITSSSKSLKGKNENITNGKEVDSIFKGINFLQRKIFIGALALIIFGAIFITTNQEFLANIQDASQMNDNQPGPENALEEIIEDEEFSINLEEENLYSSGSKQEEIEKEEITKKPLQEDESIDNPNFSSEQEDESIDNPNFSSEQEQNLEEESQSENINQDFEELEKIINDEEFMADQGSKQILQNEEYDQENQEIEEKDNDFDQEINDLFGNETNLNEREQNNNANILSGGLEDQNTEEENLLATPSSDSTTGFRENSHKVSVDLINNINKLFGNANLFSPNDQIVNNDQGFDEEQTIKNDLGFNIDSLVNNTNKEMDLNEDQDMHGAFTNSPGVISGILQLNLNKNPKYILLSSSKKIYLDTLRNLNPVIGKEIVVHYSGTLERFTIEKITIPSKSMLNGTGPEFNLILILIGSLILTYSFLGLRRKQSN